MILDPQLMSDASILRSEVTNKRGGCYQYYTGLMKLRDSAILHNRISIWDSGPVNKMDVPGFILILHLCRCM